MSMTFDPLAPYRKAPLTTKDGGELPEWRDEYEAFAAKDKVSRLRIRSMAAPVNAPGYNILLNVIYDNQYTNFILVYSVLHVLVQGRNLQKVVFAIENDLADYIQEYDLRRWAKPKDPAAPFIESIVITVIDGNGANTSTVTKH